MSLVLSEEEIKSLGFDWTEHPLIKQYLIVENDRIDLPQTIERMRSSRDFYQRLLNFSLNSSAMTGEYQQLHSYNRSHSDGYNDQLFCFSRYEQQQKLLVVANFADKDQGRVQIKLPASLTDCWQLTDGEYLLTEQLYGTEQVTLTVTDGIGELYLSLPPLASMILQLEG